MVSVPPLCLHSVTFIAALGKNLPALAPSQQNVHFHKSYLGFCFHLHVGKRGDGSNVDLVPHMLDVLPKGLGGCASPASLPLHIPG